MNDFMEKVNIHRKQLIKKYRKKVIRSCSFINIQKDKPWFITHVKKYSSLTFLKGLQYLEYDKNPSHCYYLKKGNTCTVAEIKFEEHHWVIKRFNIKNITHGLKRMVTPSRGKKCWRNAHALDLIGIKVPLPLAFMEKRRGPFKRESYYISQYVAGDDLFIYVEKNKFNPTKLHGLRDNLRTLFKGLYNGGITHGDMKATNFIVNEQGEVVLIDLDSITFHGKWFSYYWQKDMRRFMKNWEFSMSLTELFEPMVSEFL